MATNQINVNVANGVNIGVAKDVLLVQTNQHHCYMPKLNDWYTFATKQKQRKRKA